MVSAETQSRTKILVADDEDLFLHSTADLLRDEGYDCDTVTNSTDGLAALQSSDYGLLIADINMPGNTDLDFIRRGKSSFPHLPVILVTGYPEVETAVKGIELSISNYLLKPIETEPLLLKVKEAVARPRLDFQMERPLGFQHLGKEDLSYKRVIDQRGRILYVSEELARLLGFQPWELIQRPVEDLSETAILPLNGEAKTPGTVIALRRLLTKSGESLDALTVRRPFSSFGGYPAVLEEFVIGILDSRSQSGIRPLDGGLDPTGLITGGIAHDLNNMLNVVDGYLLLSQELLHPSHSLQDYFEESRLALGKASRMSRQLIDLTKPARLYELCAIDIHRLLSEISSITRISINPRSELVITAPERLPDLVGNREGLFDALFNLVSNASDSHSEKGGVIHIYVETVEKDFAEQLPLPGPFLAIHVIDNGCGIPADQLARVREPFFTTKREGEGTGLGLSVVQRAVAEMNGSLEIESHWGMGTAVRLLLPCQSGFANGDS